jgi:hypothetical protein
MAEWSGKLIPSFKLVPDPDRRGASDGNAAQAVMAAIAEVVEKTVGRVVSVEPIRDSSELAPTAT